MKVEKKALRASTLKIISANEPFVSHLRFSISPPSPPLRAPLVRLATSLTLQLLHSAASCCSSSLFKQDAHEHLEYHVKQKKRWKEERADWLKRVS